MKNMLFVLLTFNKLSQIISDTPLLICYICISNHLQISVTKLYNLGNSHQYKNDSISYLPFRTLFKKRFFGGIKSDEASNERYHDISVLEMFLMSLHRFGGRCWIAEKKQRCHSFAWSIACLCTECSDLEQHLHKVLEHPSGKIDLVDISVLWSLHF